MAPRKLTIDDYEITRDGKVINKITNHTLSPQPNGKGYLRVCIGGQLMFVHRLVAQKYIPNPEKKEQVNHKDGNKLNNCVENLEWVSNKENREHAVRNKLHLQAEDCPWSKLNWEKVKYIREHRNEDAWDLAELFGVSHSTIWDVWQYRSWKE